jgi:hypothetical protein
MVGAKREMVCMLHMIVVDAAEQEKNLLRAVIKNEA